MSGCVDIMMHTMERYFSHEMNTELTDSLAEGLLKTVMHQAKILLKNPQDYDARSEIFWAGSLSHNGLTGCGRNFMMRCHQIEHELSGMYDRVAHGAGLAAIWSSWAKYVLPENPKRFARLAQNVANVECGKDPVSTALKGIEKFEEFFASVGMPTRISHLGIEINEDLASLLAKKCSNSGTHKIGKFRPLDESDMKQIYLNAK